MYVDSGWSDSDSEGSRLIVDLESVVGVAGGVVSHEVQIVEVEVWIKVEIEPSTEVKKNC